MLEEGLCLYSRGGEPAGPSRSSHHDTYCGHLHSFGVALPFVGRRPVVDKAGVQRPPRLSEVGSAVLPLSGWRGSSEGCRSSSIGGFALPLGQLDGSVCPPAWVCFCRGRCGRPMVVVCAQAAPLIARVTLQGAFDCGSPGGGLRFPRSMRSGASSALLCLPCRFRACFRCLLGGELYIGAVAMPRVATRTGHLAPDPKGVYGAVVASS